MTYLELCQKVRELASIPGTGPASVANQQGMLKLVVGWVQDALIDLEALHPTWKFRRKLASSALVANAKTYTPAQLGYTDIEEILKGSLYAGERQLSFVDWDDWTARRYHIKNDTGDTSCYTQAPDGSYQFYPVPNSAPALTFEYRRTPQFLVANGDTPNLPAQYHMAIVNLALSKYANFDRIGDAALVAKVDYENMLLNMFKTELPGISLGGQ
jgi:hypothetical protein